MRMWPHLAAGLSVVVMLWTGPALAQGKPACDAQGRLKTPEKVEGQIVKLEAARGKVTVRASDGTVHEFQGSPETLQGFNVGDRIQARLREAPKCP
jgi:hypothetical protein